MGQWTSQVVPDSPDSVGNPSHGAWVAYIKLVPLSEEEVKRVKEEREGGKNRRLWAHNDAWSYHYAFRPVSAADIRREIEPFRDSDFSRLYWEAASGDRWLQSWVRQGSPRLERPGSTLTRLGDWDLSYVDPGLIPLTLLPAGSPSQSGGPGFHSPPHQPSPGGSASATPPQGGSDQGGARSRAGGGQTPRPVVRIAGSSILDELEAEQLGVSAGRSAASEIYPREPWIDLARSVGNRRRRLRRSGSFGARIPEGRSPVRPRWPPAAGLQGGISG